MKRIAKNITPSKVKAIALEGNYAQIKNLPLDIVILGISIIILSLLGIIILVG